jgi:hypothetical protein
VSFKFDVVRVGAVLMRASCTPNTDQQRFLSYSHFGMVNTSTVLIKVSTTYQTYEIITSFFELFLMIATRHICNHSESDTLTFELF